MARTFANYAYFRNANGEAYQSYNGTPYAEGDARITAKEYETENRESAKVELRKLLKPGATVYTILNHRSASGMSRCITLAIGCKDGSIRKLDYLVATAQGEHINNKHGGLNVSGCGMDMGFHLVYNLGRMLYPKGARKGRGGRPDTDGGYALNHAWL